MADELNTAAAATETAAAAASEAPLMGGAPEAVAVAPEAAKAPETEGAKPLMAEGEAPKEQEAETAEAVDYGKTLKLPEGFEMNAPVMEKAAALFAKGKIAPELAQELMDLDCGQLGDSAKEAEQRSVETVTGWRNTIVNRPEYQTELPLVQLAIADMSREAPEIRALYNDPVFGNMPELWQIALAFGKRFQTEGSMLSGGRDGAPTEQSLPEKLYPTMKQ